MRIVLQLWGRLWDRIWLWLTDYDLSDADIQRVIAKARREMEADIQRAISDAREELEREEKEQGR
jgi:hypothetical protein